MLDCYLTGSSDRLCQEAPVPIVTIAQREDVPGGAGNAAANLAGLGANVILLSVRGQDEEGDQLSQILQQKGISDRSIIAPQRKTLTKQRLIAGSQLIARFDQGDTHAVSDSIEQQIIQQLDDLFPKCDAVLVSDYGYGILTTEVIDALARLQSRFPRVLVVDSKQLNRYQEVGITAVKPNYGQAMQLLGLQKQTHDRVEQVLPHGDRLLALTGAKIVAATLDAEGAIIFERGQTPFQTTVKSAPQHHTSGAGDTYISALTLALAAHASTQVAASIAKSAASVVVKQPGTTVCTVEALRHYLANSEKLITDYSSLATCVQNYRTSNRRIVLTNGCFDILHPGHVSYLTQAKTLGDILIVGVNTDESVRQLKGEERPVNSLSDRLAVLSALNCVDHVVPFGDLTPHHLIRIIQPDVFVKGGDYTRETLPEASLVEDLGGEVIILPYIGGRSTTELIHRIRQVNNQSEINT